MGNHLLEFFGDLEKKNNNLDGLKAIYDKNDPESLVSMINRLSELPAEKEIEGVDSTIRSFCKYGSFNHIRKELTKRIRQAFKKLTPSLAPNNKRKFRVVEIDLTNNKTKQKEVTETRIDIASSDSDDERISSNEESLFMSMLGEISIKVGEISRKLGDIKRDEKFLKYNY